MKCWTSDVAIAEQFTKIHGFYNINDVDSNKSICSWMCSNSVDYTLLEYNINFE